MKYTVNNRGPRGLVVYTIYMNGYETFDVSILEKMGNLNRYIESLFFFRKGTQQAEMFGP